MSEQTLDLEEIKHATGEARRLLMETMTGVSVREFVERWDRVWGARSGLVEAFDQADHLVAEYEKAGRDLSRSAAENLGKLMGFTRDFLVAMTTDKAPTPEQRMLAALERIEERLTAVEASIERL